MITQGQTAIFKANCLSGLENFTGTSPYVYKIALYTANANLGPGTTAYTTDGEISGTGYTAAGKALTIVPVATDNSTTAYISFANVTWDPASFTARGALIYNSTTGAAVCVLDFGSDKTSSSVFTVQFPSPTNTSAIIRIS